MSGNGFALLAGMKTEQRLADSLRDEAAHIGFAMELHLALLRMDIHIHGGGVDLHEQAADRVTPFHERRVIALHKGEVESAIFHGTTVHEHMLVLACGTGDAGRAHEAPHSDFGFRISDYGFFPQRRFGCLKHV